MGSGFTIGSPNEIGYLASAIDRIVDAELPAAVNRTLLESTSLSVGEVLGVRLFGQNRSIRITGAVESFPTTDAEEPLVIADLPTLELMRFAVGRQRLPRRVVDPDNRRPGRCGGRHAARRAADGRLGRHRR